MGSLFSSIDISRLGLQASQVQLNVTSHNIANVNTEGYSRQRAELSTPFPIKYSYGQLGRGVTIAQVTRIRDAFLDQVYRDQHPTLGGADVKARYFSLVEDAFLEPSEDGFSTRINAFFDGMNDFANNVEQVPVREATVAQATALAESMNELAERFNDLRTSANEEVRSLVPRINSLADTIAATNVQIRDSELDNTIANDIRDERDRALDELSRLVNINYTERKDGQVTVRIGSDVLVDETGARQIEARFNNALDPERGDLLELRWTDSELGVQVREGELAGALEMRDEIIPFFDQRMDEIAASIIEQINGIHSQANGLVNWTGIVAGTNAVDDPTAALDAAGLPFDVTLPGSFDVAVYNGDTPIAGSPFTVTLNPGDSLDDLAAQLSAIAPGQFEATVAPDNTLQLGVSDPALNFAFANDTSGVLAALGINGLFTGTDARSIAVNSDIIDDPRLLASGYSLDPLATGDNSAALDMAAVRDFKALDGGSSDLNDYYESTIAELGVDAQANQVVLTTEEQFNQDFETRRQEVSGVSIDEEVTLMIQYQRAYEANARVINVVERMLDALFTIGA